MPDLGRDKKWWPVREFVGRDCLHRKVSREVYRNMETGEIHAPVGRNGEYKGWSGEPPATEERIIVADDNYRRNYERIFRK